MELRIETIDDIALIRRREQAYVYLGETFRAALNDLLNEGVYKYILDLTDSRYLHSDEIGSILNHHRRVFGRGGFVIVKPNDRVRYMLDLFCPSGQAAIVDSIEDAFDLLNRTPRC